MTTTMSGDDRERSRYLVGIDLGTTNSAVAYIDTRERTGDTPRVHGFDVPQLVAEGDTQPRSTLPSFLYLPGAHELPAGATRLPWDPARDHAVGEFARRQGARVPARLVTSAKSWLCHGGVDRTARILPWGDASDEVARLSPVEASSRYLAHMREAWNHAIAGGDESLFLERQEVALTVPASFDEVARELTLEAARQAGLTRVTMIEEPQAAFYAWIVGHESSWRESLHAGQVILVCDVGGGTTDFTLIVVDEGQKGLRFERVAVGEHLLLGGDNMDLALARRVEERLTGKTGKLEPQAWAGLVHAARLAKEDLLAEESGAPTTVPITLLGKSTSVVGGLLRDELARDETAETILSGFFPLVPPDAEPERRKAGFSEFGLPYVADAAVTKHLASFLRRHRDAAAEINPRSVSKTGLVRPDAILFNGAALTPEPLRHRVRDAIAQWFKGEDPAYEPVLLTSPSLALAVARGAAYYGHVRRGKGVRIHGGSARGYYVGIDLQAAPPEAAQAVAGLADPVAVVSVVRRGTEEGTTVELDRPFEAHVNRPVAFNLYSSSVRTDPTGDLVVVERDAVVPLPPIRTLLRFGKKTGERRLPVRIGARLTELGTLDIYCFSKETEHRWRLEFQLRDAMAAAAEGEAAPGGIEDRGVTIDESIVEGLDAVIRACFDPTWEGEPIPPARVMRELRTVLDLEKEEWPLPVLRKLGELLLKVRESRRKSAAHDARWTNLAGYALRPGFGYPMDDWRLKELWKIWHAGILHPGDEQCRTEWWILWRRVAGGLSQGQQEQIHAQLAPSLVAGPAKRSKEGKRLGKQEQVEMWRCAVSLEELDRARKVDYGQALADRVERGATAADLWALGRVGARVPFHGPANQVVNRRAVEGWIRRLVVGEWRLPEATAVALAHMARRTGDRERDIDEGLRAEAAEKIARAAAGAEGKTKHAFERARVLVLEGGELEREEASEAFGEALPAGLVLVGE